MKLTQLLTKRIVCLNKHTWDRRVWEKGYYGPPLPIVKRTGRAPQVVTDDDVNEVRGALMREWNVMQWLANPYLNALVVFLNKATLLLQPGPTREGIQLRFTQFGDLVQACQISEACLKKLNFVVDAIDRHVYDEAWQFFEQMVASFHNDCTIGGWAHGVRLLLQELRKHSSSHAPGRSHSAGTRLTH
uniref:GLOBIN domain-containing protein n=1 Tax=Globodera pallida TaxID=36090 RepID=A0A183BRY5_GLOPA